MLSPTTVAYYLIPACRLSNWPPFVAKRSLIFHPNQLFMKFILTALFFATLPVLAQDLNGIWRGTLSQDPGGCYPVYNLELQINYNNGTIGGRSYDYYDSSKFVKLQFNGRYNAQNNRMVIIESKVVEYNIPGDCIPCVKTYDLSWSKTGKEETLKGTYKGLEMGSRKICPAGNIVLKRVTEAVFKPAVEQSEALATLQQTLQLKTRDKEIMHTLKLDAAAITIDLYDNAEIDNDTVTVLLNNTLLLYKQRLTGKPHRIQLTAFPNTDYELLMYADNLGLIPPNTALMVIQAGPKKYELRLSSSEQKSAVVRFRYDK